jgi:CheY-like chemotaxis protein
MKRILIIEDDSIISSVYSAKYKSAGFETSCAADGEDGLRQLKTFKPDLVHLDLNIPKVNGAEVIKHARSQPETQFLPIVVLSNTYQNRLVKQALEAGASECVSKATCTPKMMLELVERYRTRAAATPLPPPVTEAKGAPAAPGPGPADAPEVETPYTARIQRHVEAHDDIARGFLTRAPQKLSAMREKIALLFSSADTTRAADLADLCRVAESLGGQAAVSGFERVSQVSLALAALVQELLDKPEAFTPSTLHTIVAASDFLATLLEGAPEAKTAPRAPVILVVDDDPVPRRMVSLSMARLGVPTIMVDQGQAALSLLAENQFALIFLDIEMPQMDGFEVCRQLRGMPAHEATPVVYVSSLADEASRAKAMASGGTDMVAKPFLPMELAVKALTLLR